MKKISVVLPCFNESENLPLLVPEIVKNIPKSYDYEIICIDDGELNSGCALDKRYMEEQDQDRYQENERFFEGQSIPPLSLWIQK